MRRVLTKTTYLEMCAPGPLPTAAPLLEIRIDRVRAPSVAEYRKLYNLVGRDYHWVDRNLLADEDLRTIIQDERVEIYLLEVEGQPAGYAELDCRRPDEIELAYFGLFPQFIGKGLGRFFLQWTLQQAWSHGPQRVWVHTCDLDHAAALPMYLKAGFVVYDEKLIEQVVLIPRGAGRAVRRRR